MHKSNGGDSFWDSQKEYVIDLYINSRMSANKIAKIYNCDASTICRHLKRWNIQIRKERYNSKYSIRTDCFDIIDDEQSAYFFGLLYADGHLSKQGCIMLTMKDLDIVEKYKAFLETDKPITINKYGNYELNIKCKRIYDSLVHKGFNNRKSYYIDFSYLKSFVPDVLEHHFVRGMFDGDGSIRVYKYDYINTMQIHFGFTGLLEAVNYIKQYFGINTKTVKESDITYTCVSSSRQKVIEIYNMLYANATVYINRKHDTFEKIVFRDLQRL